MDNWRRRWLITRVCLGASLVMAVGLFAVSTQHASAISGAITTIVLVLLGFVGTYISGAVVDDNSVRKYKGEDKNV